MSTGLPLVVVTTVDGEEPTFDLAYPPEGSAGKGITNVTKVPGRVMVILRGDTLFDSGEYASGSAGMTIRVRGNSSAWSVKHPFKIKLQRKGDMLRRGDERYADKDWVLIYEDPYSLSNAVARQVCGMLCMEYVPSGEYVNLLFNGDYRGLYFLSESVSRNPSCRIDVDKDTGYIIELDPYWWNEDVWFETTLTRGSPFRRYTFKHPDSEDVVQECFLRLMQSGKTFASCEHEKAWLIVTASNLCKNALKHASRRQETLEDHPELPTADDGQTGEMLDAILRLPASYKTVVYLYYFEGYTTPEIAVMLGCPKATVQSRLFRARKLMKRWLGGDLA